ncbi:DUF2989 domain-containing protein [Shewanella pealeana]|uniref:DUF2989 domain-containing protein n=1 Tax=Shewanella pealeana (strain ATCC 700345 / ANG-SQ1) TaxID=398579 RepID=A8H4D8_SHEPA|nr:DUF2989 domain-containing protein [Shewanella pealeana]ABV87425.1 conserved hypothetical protein [Shewanella pealeana ATCC 700345]
MFTSFFGITVFLGLFGCEQPTNTQAICNKNPELCADLHDDSWCRFERGDLIRNRFKLKSIQMPSGEQIYQQLLYLEDYNKCVELAAGVQHILHPERTNERARAFGLSSQTLAQLQETTRGSLDPHLAYYHWSRFNDNEAEAVLFAAEKANKINDIDLQAQLASYYLRIDPLKSKQLYAQVFQGSNQDNFQPDWLLALASLYRFEERGDIEYWLSKANIEITGAKFSSEQMLALIKGNKKLQLKLDHDAILLAEQLEAGKYQQSKLKILLDKDLTKSL